MNGWQVWVVYVCLILLLSQVRGIMEWAVFALMDDDKIADGRNHEL